MYKCVAVFISTGMVVWLFLTIFVQIVKNFHNMYTGQICLHQHISLVYYVISKLSELILAFYDGKENIIIMSMNKYIVSETNIKFNIQVVSMIKLANNNS